MIYFKLYSLGTRNKATKSIFVDIILKRPKKKKKNITFNNNIRLTMKAKELPSPVSYFLSGTKFEPNKRIAKKEET